MSAGTNKGSGHSFISIAELRGGRSRTVPYHDRNMMLILPLVAASQVPQGKKLR